MSHYQPTEAEDHTDEDHSLPHENELADLIAQNLSLHEHMEDGCEARQATASLPIEIGQARPESHFSRRIHETNVESHTVLSSRRDKSRSTSSAMDGDQTLESGDLPESSAQAAQREFVVDGSRPLTTGKREGATEREKSSIGENNRVPTPSRAETRPYNSPGLIASRSSSNASQSQIASQSPAASSSQQQNITLSSYNNANNEIMLPAWQPDSEVDECPICERAFGFFSRKHHCRKCGRVVCNACSPHRITIPYQYIVQPPTGVYDCTPDHTRNRSSTLSQISLHDPDMGGGMKVRLCNPCVPDPNISPPTPNPTTLDRPLPPLPSSNSSPPVAESSSNGRTRVRRSELCFICGDRLPPSTTAIEAHIDACISRHLNQNRTGEAETRTSASRPQLSSISEQPHSSSSLPAASHAARHSSRPRHTSDASTLGNVQDAARNSATGQVATEAAPSRPFLSSRMICYWATKHDTIGDDSECIICMEDFEAGDHMARLECLCKYHKKCIDGWFWKHPGRCPVHGQDNY